METTVEQLIKERTFASLTEAELQSVKELCETEEEFMSMKQFFQELETIAASQKTIIQPEIKESLNAIFSAKFPGIRANWTVPEAQPVAAAPVIPLYQRTWVRVAAVALLVLGTIPFWNLIKTDVPVKEKVFTAKLEIPKTETATPAEDVNKIKAASPMKPAEPVLKEEELSTRSLSTGENHWMSDEVTVSSVSGSMIASGSAVAPLSFSWTSSNQTVAADGLAQQYTTDKGVSKELELRNGFIASEAKGTEGMYFSSVAKPDSFSAFGRKADLYPGEVTKGEVNSRNALSLAEQPDDLLELLVPAF